VTDLPATQTGILEKVVIQGDLSRLSEQERVTYYARVCESIGVNPLTRPFDYIKLNGRLVLYARRDAADQLRKIHDISLTIPSREMINDLYIVTARGTTPEGRTDESTGVVSVAGLKGDSLANALMKAETKAKRRVTLSIVGLGWLDETEVATVPGAVEQEPDAKDNGGEAETPRSFWDKHPEKKQGIYDRCAEVYSLNHDQVDQIVGDWARFGGITAVGNHIKANVDKLVKKEEAAASGRPYSPAQLKAHLVAMAEQNHGVAPLTDGAKGAIVGALDALSPDRDPVVRKAKRYSLFRFVNGVDSSKKLDDAWLRAYGDWAQSEHAAAELAAVIEVADVAAGQQRMPAMAAA